MSLLLASFVGIIFAASVYLLLQRKRFDVLLGFAMFANAVNLAILGGTGWAADKAPPVLDSEYEKVQIDGVYTEVSTVIPDAYVDPIPQALILTAIVIGFALVSYFVVLVSELTKRERGEEEEPE